MQEEALADLRLGTQLLLRAYEYACDVQCDRWQFAVELSHLQRSGLSVCDCRWLISRRYVEHAAETSTQQGPQRLFESRLNTRFDAASCFVLTDLGYKFISNLLQSHPDPAPQPTYFAVEAATPAWDPATRMLKVGHQVVKHFRVPAPIQEIILNSFHEEAWPQRVDDPLPPSAEINPKRRVQTAIMSLNRNQQNRLIQFRGDGRGQGIVWELVNTTDQQQGVAPDEVPSYN